MRKKYFIFIFLLLFLVLTIYTPYFTIFPTSKIRENKLSTKEYGKKYGYFRLFTSYYQEDNYIHLALENGSYRSADLTFAIRIDYGQNNFEVGENLTFYCQDVVTGKGLFRIEFLNSIQYTLLQEGYPYTPLINIICNNNISINYQITTIDTYYLVIWAHSIDISTLFCKFRIGFVGDISFPTLIDIIFPLLLFIEANIFRPLFLLPVIVGVLVDLIIISISIKYYGQKRLLEFINENEERI